MYCLWLFSGIVRSPLLYSPLGQSNLVGGTVYCLWPFSGSFRHHPFLQSATSLVRPPVVGTNVYCLWMFYGIVRSPLLYSPLGQSNLVGGTVYCLWPFSGSFRHGPFLHSVTSPILPPPPPVVGTYVYCLWTFHGIVGSPLSYSFLGQSNLVGTYVHFLWPFSGIVRSLLLFYWNVARIQTLYYCTIVWNRFNVTNHYK